MRSFFLFSLLVAAASAFVAPANQAVGKFKFCFEDFCWGSRMMGRSVKVDDVINLVPEGRRSWMEKDITFVYLWKH